MYNSALLVDPIVNASLPLPNIASEIIPNETFASEGLESFGGLEGMSALVVGGILPNPLRRKSQGVLLEGVEYLN